MKLCGTKIGGEKGTSQGIETLPAFSKQCTDAGQPAIDIQLFPSQHEANLALTSGRVDGVLSGDIGMAYASKLSGGPSSSLPAPAGIPRLWASPCRRTRR